MFLHIVLNKLRGLFCSCCMCYFFWKPWFHIVFVVCLMLSYRYCVVVVCSVLFVVWFPISLVWLHIVPELCVCSLWLLNVCVLKYLCFALRIPVLQVVHSFNVIGCLYRLYNPGMYSSFRRRTSLFHKSFFFHKFVRRSICFLKSIRCVDLGIEVCLHFVVLLLW